MRELYDVFDGDLTIKEETVLHGIVNGNVTVPRGEKLLIYGIINGDLFVKKDGMAKVRGTINGSIWNDCGVVELHGSVKSVFEKGDAITIVDKAAVVTEPNKIT